MDKHTYPLGGSSSDGHSIRLSPFPSSPAKRLGVHGLGVPRAFVSTIAWLRNVDLDSRKPSTVQDRLNMFEPRFSFSLSVLTFLKSKGQVHASRIPVTVHIRMHCTNYLQQTQEWSIHKLLIVAIVLLLFRGVWLYQLVHTMLLPIGMPENPYCTSFTGVLFRIATR